MEHLVTVGKKEYYGIYIWQICPQHCFTVLHVMDLHAKAALVLL